MMPLCACTVSDVCHLVPLIRQVRSPQPHIAIASRGGQRGSQSIPLDLKHERVVLALCHRLYVELIELVLELDNVHAASRCIGNKLARLSARAGPSDVTDGSSRSPIGAEAYDLLPPAEVALKRPHRCLPRAPN